MAEYNFWQDSVVDIVHFDGGGELSDLYGARGAWSADAERLEYCVGGVWDPIVL